MKQSLLILSLIILGVGQAFSQNYYYYTSPGSTPPFNWEENSKTATAATLIAAPANDVLSSAQTIPFSWSFYGQTVTSYKASDNGYITFDPNATKSYPNSVALPDTASAAPKSAIFALWTDLSIPSIPAGETAIGPAVLSWTYGTAPNRVHVIEWAYAGKQGVALSGSNEFIFCIQLYEGGGFDIVHTLDIGAINNAVIGVQNGDGTLGKMVDGSPYLGAINPTGSGANAADIVYTFKYGVQPVLDAALTANVTSQNSYFRRTVPTFVNNDNSVVISGSIVNNGAVPITSVTFNYTVDGGPIQTDKLTGINAQRSGGTASFYNSKFYTATGPGQFHNVNIWISNFNDSLVNHETGKDSLSQQIFVINGGTFNITKQPLIEEITGAWCGFCPDGHLDATAIINENPQVIVVTQHTTDSMMTSNSADFANFFGQGLEAAPFATIDRHYYTDDATIQAAQASLAFDRSYWSEGVNDQLNTSSIPVSLEIPTKTWDSTTRTITFTVTGSFKDYAGGNLMLNAYVCEDSLRGSNSEPYTNQFGWNQHNYYSKLWTPAVINAPTSPLYNEPASMIGYKHNHVVRKALTGSWGVPLTGTNPAIATPNQTFTKTFTYTMPKETKVKYPGEKAAIDDFYSTVPGRGNNKPDMTYLVAFVSCYNATDPTYNEILNATQQPLFGWSAGVAKYNVNIDKISMYPNPASSSTNIEYTLTKSTDLTIEVYNVMGQKVQTVLSGNQVAGLHTISMDASHLSNGLYFVTFISNGSKTTKQLMIQK